MMHASVVAAFAALTLFGTMTSGCTELIRRKVVTSNAGYYSMSSQQGQGFETVAEGVHSYRDGWYRNLVIETDEGLVVVDPMGPEMARGLAQEIEKKLGGRPVRMIIYSHYHLDHVTGGAELSPQEIIAHRNCERHWDDLGNDEVLRPTRYVEGDTVLEIGGRKIELIQLDRVHTDGLYAVYLRDEKILFTADFGMVRTMPPNGIPEHYGPTYVAEGRRLAELDFDVFVPSHFGIGTKADFTDYFDMYERVRADTRRFLAQHGRPGNERWFASFYDELYVPLRRDYRDWDGFDEMAIFLLTRGLIGEMLGS